jgi:hypothetical protein
MKMTPDQLRRLIYEVLNEEPQPPVTPPQPLPNLSKYNEKKKDTVIKLKVSGLKDSQVKKVLSRLSYDAMKNDLNVIHVELEKNGQKAASLSPEEIEAQASLAGKQQNAQEEPETVVTIQQWNRLSPEQKAEYELIGDDKWNELSPEDQEKRKRLPIHIWKQMSGADRAMLIKKGMAPDERDLPPGQSTRDWKAAEEKDRATAVERKRKRDSLLASGNLKMDTYTKKDGTTIELPEDTGLWTDKEWDMWNSDEIKMSTAQSGKNAGKQVYRPNLGKKTAQGKKGAVSADFSDKLKD